MKRIIGIALLGVLLVYASSHEINLPFVTKSENAPVKKVLEQTGPRSKIDLENETRWLTAILVARKLKASMHNPGSFDLETAIRMSDGTLCFTYRARNAFNALILSHAVITSKRAMTDGQDGFVSYWNQHCGGKKGEDITGIKYNL